MSNIFLPCIKVTELIERRNFEKLSFIENTQLEMHKKMCKPCRSYEKESVFLEKYMTNKSINDNQSNLSFETDLKDKIFDLIKTKN